MEHSSPVSKVVATSTPNSWAQAYNAGKLHLVLSFAGETTENIASLGKETLERLQREFFALDEKTLSHLEKVVATVATDLPSEFDVSLVLTTIVGEVLYIIIYNSGIVLLKRNNSIVSIGIGQEKQISSFSGVLQPHDIILVGTKGLLETVSIKNIEKSLIASSPHEVSENIAPFLHNNATGTEAGLIWTMIGKTQTHTDSTPEEDSEHPNDILDLDEQKDNTKKTLMLPSIQSVLSKIHISSLKRLSKKQLIILSTIILICILGISLFFEKTNKENAKQTKTAEKIISDNKSKYDDAIALMSLNRSLAIEELQEIKTDVEKKIDTFPKETNARKTLETFLSQVNNALGREHGSSQINVFFDASKSSEIPTVSAITAKGEKIAVIGGGKGALLNTNGTIDKKFNVEDNTRGITADEENVYVLAGNTVEKIEKSNSSVNTIIQKQADPISIDNFGGNIYLLSQTDKTIYRYSPNSFQKTSYFVSNTTLSNPSSMTIDSSIYVIDSGTVKKFTRGKEDAFSYKGKKLSTKSQIYTDIDYTNLYILDPEKKKTYVVDKSGNPVSEVALSGMKNPTSIASDEKGKKIFIVSGNKVYSIDF